MKTNKPTEPAVASDLSGLAAQAQAMLKSHIDTFTRKDGTVVQAHDDKRLAAQPIVPSMGANAKALRASSKSGDMDHEANQAAATHMEAGDHKSLKSSLQSMDTGARDHVLDHIHPDHWESLGFKPLNKDKAVKDHDAKFGAKPAAAKPAAKPKAAKPADAAPAGGMTADTDSSTDHAHEEYAYQQAQKHAGDLEKKGFGPGVMAKHPGGVKNGETSVFTHKDGRTATVSMTKNSGGSWDKKWKTSLSHGGAKTGDKPVEAAPAPAGGDAPAQADSNSAKWDDLSDEQNPKHALSRIGSKALGQAAQGKDDLKIRAKVELANRGMDSDNKWVGFDKAKAHHGVETTKGDADEMASHFQTIHGSVLSAAAKGHLDLNKQAKHSLANRGEDSSGNWLGFAKAKEHHFGADKAADAPKPAGKTMAKALFFASPECMGELQELAKSQKKD